MGAQFRPTLQSQGLQPTRLYCPWNLHGKNTRVDYHFLLQGSFPTHRLNPCPWCLLQLAGGFFTTSVTWEAPHLNMKSININERFYVHSSFIWSSHKLLARTWARCFSSAQDPCVASGAAGGSGPCRQATALSPRTTSCDRCCVSYTSTASFL